MSSASSSGCCLSRMLSACTGPVLGQQGSRSLQCPLLCQAMCTQRQLKQPEAMLLSLVGWRLQQCQMDAAHCCWCWSTIFCQPSASLFTLDTNPAYSAIYYWSVVGKQDNMPSLCFSPTLSYSCHTCPTRVPFVLSVFCFNHFMPQVS